jgi:hypothetical protein
LIGQESIKNNSIHVAMEKDRPLEEIQSWHNSL